MLCDQHYNCNVDCNLIGSGSLSECRRCLTDMQHVLGHHMITHEQGPCAGPKFPTCTTSQATPIIAAKHPFKVALKAGKMYPWCSCGHSKKQPFCDGSHRDAAPGLSPVRFTPTEDKEVWLCGCKQTKKPPYCDGTHKESHVQNYVELEYHA